MMTLRLFNLVCDLCEIVCLGIFVVSIALAARAAGA